MLACLSQCSGAAALALACFSGGVAAEPIVHELDSPRQTSRTTVRVLLPDKLPRANEPPLRTVYILPVEAGEGARWGDALAEVQKNNLHNKYHLACCFPTFSDLPWFADHPENASLQQEAYLLRDVLPLVEKNHPIQGDRQGRLLLGFSKSGWGAWSLLLRHPQIFHRAVAFDAPLMMDAPGKYGSGPIFGNADNFRKYQISTLLTQRASELQDQPARLLLIGQGNFHSEHVQMKAHLESLHVQHAWHAGSVREHSWHSGWVSVGFDWLAEEQFSALGHQR